MTECIYTDIFKNTFLYIYPLINRGYQIINLALAMVCPLRTDINYIFKLFTYFKQKKNNNKKHFNALQIIPKNYKIALPFLNTEV